MRYHEEIKFFSRSFFYILAVLVITGLWIRIEGAVSAVLPVIVAVMFPLFFGRLLITVSSNTLRVSFGYLGIINRDIPISEIRETRVVEFRPVRQFGGWGVRCGKFEGEITACYSLKGKKGLLLSLTHTVRICLLNTDRIIIGSTDPEKLKESIGR